MSAVLPSTTVSLVLLWVVLPWLYRDYRIDPFEERTLALRCELLELAHIGVLDPNEQAYRMLRTTVDGFSRLAGCLGLTTALLAMPLVGRGESRDGKGFVTSFHAARKALTAPQPARIDAIVLRMNSYVLEQILFASPFFVVTLVPYFLKRILRQGISLRRDQTRSQWITLLDSVALRYGVAM